MTGERDGAGLVFGYRLLTSGPCAWQKAARRKALLLTHVCKHPSFQVMWKKGALQQGAGWEQQSEHMNQNDGEASIWLNLGSATASTMEPCATLKPFAPLL